MNITINGRIPSKKNSKIMVYNRGSRPLLLPSKQHKEWHDEQIKLLPKLKEPIEQCVIEMDIYAPDNRATDLSNKAESIMDLLVDAGIIKDDNWFVVSSLCLSFAGVDKENPRVEITIT